MTSAEEASAASEAERARVRLSFVVIEPPERWRMEEEDVPETPLHDVIIEVLVLVLKQWVAATGRDALVARNLGCRWDPKDDRIGTDSDVVLIEPAPPEGEGLSTLRVFEPGHAAPRLAIEIVSEHSGVKDYQEAPARCARLGVEELWVFDPEGHGPRWGGGPFPIQIWRRPPNASTSELERTCAGDLPAFSPVLGAWLVTTKAGRRLRVADDPAGRRLWPTEAEAQAELLARARAETVHADEAAARARDEAARAAARAKEEAARAEKEAARAEKEAARAEKEAARARAAEEEARRLRELLKDPMKP